MKDKEFDELMRQKLKTFEVGFKNQQKKVGWTVLESQLPATHWHTFWQSVKQWMWLPVLMTLVAFNLYWWQQTQQMQSDTNKLQHKMDEMHGQIDSLELYIKKNPVKSSTDTVYIWHNKPQLLTSSSWSFSKGAQNVGFQTVYPFYSRSVNYIGYNNKFSNADRLKYESGNTLAAQKADLSFSDAKIDEFRRNNAEKLLDTKLREGGMLSSEKSEDTVWYASSGSDPSYHSADSSYSILDSLKRFPFIGIDSVPVKHGNIKKITVKKPIKKPTFSLGKALTRILPQRTKWGFTTGLSIPQPIWGEAYPAPSVGIQSSFIYSERWRLSLGLLYERRGYELYDVFESDYEENFIRRFPGLDTYREGDFIMDIESTQNRMLIPLQLRYFFKNDRDKLRPFLGVGWVGDLNFSQDFEYRFEDEDDDFDVPFNPNGFPSTGTDNNIRFSGGAAELSAGFEYRLSNKWQLQWGAYYQNEFSPNNVELNKFRTAGMRLTFMRGR
ncbi:MAG: hypothetical protein AAGI07_06135 [Bacteroidota bacterium]